MNGPLFTKRQRWTQQSFIDFCSSLYEGKYDYSQTEFSTVNSRVSVRCVRHDHVFTPFANDHLRGKGGCPKCKAETTGLRVKASRGITLESFLARAKDVHGDKYDYSKVVILGSTQRIEVICRVHNRSFFPTVANHLNNGTGCPDCGRLATSRKRAMSLDEYLVRAKERHGEKYDYSSVVKLERLHDKIDIICRTHGSFSQLAYDHLSGHGCDKCGRAESQPERDIAHLLTDLGLAVETEIVLPNGTKLDIYCPTLRIAIEYNGLRWHSEECQPDSRYHLKKTLEANQYGIHLIHIWEDDWVFSKEKTISWLKTQLGLSELKFNARELDLRQVPWSAVNEFVKRHHMQGECSAAEICYGLYTKEGALVAAMLFSRKNCNDGEICLERFCSIGLVRGGFSRLLSAFRKDHGSKYRKIISFSDRSWSTGRIYRANGFSLVSHGEPRYWWIKGQRRYNRREFQRRYLPERLEVFDPALSEAENCRANGYRKLYDCGVTKWELTL